MNNINELYNIWLENTSGVLHEELEKIKGNEDEILDRFYRNLEFGTAGLRGVLGAGTNRMNIYTVCQATQGLADYVNSLSSGGSVVIGYDSRINSDVFARECACVLAANGVKAYLFAHLVPTPMVSFAVRRLRTSSGIVITASHNPSKYNGFKCYDPAGFQMTEEAAGRTYEFIQKVDLFRDIKTMDYDAAVSEGLIEVIGDELIEEFYVPVMSRRINPDVASKAGLKVIYTPLNGTGNIPVRRVLRDAGYDVSVVSEQEMPDGTFPTCPYPNPEIRQAFECALAMAEKSPADLLLATDPDCDRVGVAVRNSDGGYSLISGNSMGVLLTEYMCSARKKNGTLPENAVMTKSFVSTGLTDLVAADYGCKVIDVLTGFKYVGEFIAQLEKQGKESDFVMGFEESYGYLIGTHARDKDAVAASLMICEMASFYKLQGKTLLDVLEDIYARHGFFVNTLHNFVFEGADGMMKMKQIMDDARSNPPASLGGLRVEKATDLLGRTVTDNLSGTVTEPSLPSANVLAYSLEGGNLAIVRPSGTEPKIKVYITGRSKTEKDSADVAEAIAAGMKNLLGID